MRFNAKILLLLFGSLFLSHSVTAGEFREYPSKGKSVPIKLLVWPRQIKAQRKAPVDIYAALVNDADSDVYIRASFKLTPMVPVGYGDLVTHIVDMSTGKEAKFKPLPLFYMFEDAQRREITEDVGADSFIGRRLNLRSCYELAPGKYRMTMRFDSRYVPSFLRPDKRAWHG